MKKIQSFLKEDVSFSLKDVMTVIVILIIYGIIAFYQLGDQNGPKTFYRLEKGEELVLELEEDTKIENVMYFNGERNSSFTIYESNDGEEYNLLKETEAKGVFTWNEVELDTETKYIKLKMEEDTSIGELALRDKKNNLIEYSSINDYLQDELDLVPDHKSYKNSTYFDEVYFARTAYEYVNHMKTYEWTHPPLGKLIQAIPIYLTNNFSPFNYRFMGNIAGIFMLLVIYIFGAVLFKKRGYAILSSIIMALDTFHFAQTRMGTVDSHLVLFIMTSALLMTCYLKTNKTKFLALSGLFFGLSICVKWTGFYAGLGLAILYFIDFISKKRKILKTILQGTVFFVVIPLILYVSLFLLFPNNLVYTNNLKNIIVEQQEMYEYHANLKDNHFFSSTWYTWPISYKPVWYHQQDLKNNQEETISGVGNLFIWLFGIVSFIFAIYKLIIKKEKKYGLLIVMVLSLWIPYVFIGRVMFLYHYFPVLPFLYLLCVGFLKELTEKLKLYFVIPVFVFSILLFFITYFPVVSGIPISKNYVRDLKLFDSWYF